MSPWRRLHGRQPWPRTTVFATAVVISVWGPSPGHAAGHEAIASPPSATQIYAGLEPSNAARASEAVQKALEHQPSGGELRWRNEQTGASGLVRPLRTFKAAEGYFCRVFLEEVVKGQEERSSERLACRDKAGRWRDAELSKAPPA